MGAAWYVLVAIWTALLFTVISICAGDFFAVNLSSIAHSLRMSDTFAGVTLLALGNGGPDIFSTWAAVSSNSLQLAVGEIVGATCFIITVVAGSIACRMNFAVRKASFLRDTSFLFVTVALLLGILVQRELHLWQGLLMIAIYISYIMWVMGYHWWISRRSNTEEATGASHSDEENMPTPTETRPLLESHAPQRNYHGRTYRHHPTPAALYWEIEEWRHAHGRCISGRNDYIVQPSLAGSVEYSARKRKSKSKHGASDGEQGSISSEDADTKPLPRLDQSDDRILSTLFPSLHGFSQKTVWEILISLLTALPFCLLKLTCPVIDNGHESRCEHGWDRSLLLLQIYLAPQFVWVVIWLGGDAPLTAESWLMPAVYCFLASMVIAAFVTIFTNSRTQPTWTPVLSLFGFALSAFWLSTIADEVVSIMKALSAIVGLSEAILGFTVFAIGNCIDDYVADMTVTEHGHPIMALAACFGGPLLNILLGLGVSITYLCARQSQAVGRIVPVAVAVDPVLVITAATVLATLAALTLALWYNSWEINRKMGIVLILVWLAATIFNVTVEVVG